jgi:hypothetical protein
MKRNILPVLAALFASAIAASAAAQAPFFLNKPGLVAEYAVKGPDGGVISYARSSVTNIDAVDEGNLTVTYNVEALDASRNPLTTPIPMTTVIKNGVVEMSPNAMGMEITGTVPSYPSNLSVGRQFDYDYAIKMMGIEATTKGKERVTARENITVQAGTFDCYRIESDVTVTTMGQTQNVKTTSWISAGVGNVRMETRDGAGNMQMSQELVSLK